MRSQDRSRDGYELWMGALVVAAVTLAFLLAWWNRFLGASSNGWHFFYGARILAGEIPYRDFYMYVPPLHPLKFTVLISLFGESLIAGRILAVAERVALAVLLFLWLSRMFPVSRAILGSLLAIIVFCGDIADALTLHHHDSVLWAVVSGLLASYGLSQARPGPKRTLAFLSGAAAALCFLSKQTTGIGVSLAVGAVFGVALWRARGQAADRALPAIFAAGWFLPVGSIALWLARHGAFLAFVDQVFVTGPSSKGTLLSVLLRPVMVPPELFLVCTLPAVIALIAVHRFPPLALDSRETARRPRLHFWQAAALAGAAVGLPMVLFYFFGAEFSDFPVACRLLEIASIYFAFLGSGVLFLHQFLLIRRPDHSDADLQLLLVSGVSLAVAYMLGLSWPAYEPMVVPALGLVTCWSLTRMPLSQPVLTAGKEGRFFVRMAPYVARTAVAIVIAAAVWLKLMVPFAWEGWKEPRVSEATLTSQQPALRGFLLSPSVVDFVDRVTSLIRANSTDRDTVYVFPHMPVFYTLSGRKPPTFAYVHWFDVTPDSVARRDARTLLSAPPAVIVMMELPEKQVQGLEKAFRGNGLSGQRELMSALRELRHAMSWPPR